MDLATSSVDVPSKEDLKGLAGLPILVIGDQPADLTVLQACLLDGGYENVQGIPGGAAALRVLADSGADSSGPGVVVVDIGMSAPDGYEVLAHIGEMAQGRGPLALAVTADSSPAGRIAALRAGASDFITKPCDPVELLTRVRNLATIKWQERELARTTLETLDDLLAAMPDAAVIVDADGRIALANAQTERTFGYGREELLGMEIEMLLPPRFRGNHSRYRTDYFAAPTMRPMGGVDLELLGLHSDGREFPVEVRLGPLRVGQSQYASAMIADVSELRGVRQAQNRLAAVVQSSDDAILSMTTDGVIQTCNPGAERLLDRPAAWIVGQPVQSLMPAEAHEMFAASCQQVCEGERVERRKIQVFRRDRMVIDVAANIFVLRDARGDLLGYSLIARDMTAEAKVQGKLERLARFDSLTGLASRAETLARLKAELNCARSPGPELGVLFCDIDNFKTINDTWGHAVGDAVLTVLADRIRECLRDGDTVGRTGGDEMLALLPGIHTLDEAARIAEKIRRHAAEPIHHDGHTIHTTVSIGATLAVPGESVSTMTDRADVAMYQSKSAGRNAVTCV